MNDDGVVTAVRNGSVVITAMNGQKTGSAQVAVADPVRRALVALYRATGGENWKNSANWLSDEPVESWHGVTAVAAGEATSAASDGATGTSARASVAGSALNLPDNGLSGTIPPELGDLVHLRELDLSNNGLTGSIPPELGKLFRLELLNLSGNRLSGPLPAELGNLFVLKSLQLQDNAELSGPLPLSFSGLSGLETLDLSGTGICAPANAGLQQWLGGVTTRRGVANCGAVSEQDRKALIALYEATNGPNWTNKTNWLSTASLDQWHGVSTNTQGRVIGLRLSGNRLSGSIPAALGNLSALAILDLGGNELSGTIPVALGNLSALVLLDLSDNRLSGPIPTGLLTLHNLQTLDLSGNLFDDPGTSLDRDVLVALYNATDGPNWTVNDNWLSDLPLSEWYGVSTNAEGRVDSLKLGGNLLTGSIPGELGNLNSLRVLDLQRNTNLSGSIPSELGNLGSLEVLEFDRVPVSGSIPPELGNLSNLRILGLSRNQLSGPVPMELGSLANLEVLWLHENAGLSGPLPGTLTSLDKVQNINLRGTGLCAPADVAFQTWLQGIGSKTGVVNCMPADDRDALIALYNATDGPNWTNSTNWLSDRPLGEWHGVTANSAGRVIGLDLFRNNVSGSMPPELGNLTMVESLGFYDNALTGAVPPELGRLTNLRVLDLGLNQISGRIPTFLGSLINLEGLSLGTQLSGQIPSELGNLSKLTSLQLRGQLSGSIPPELGNLSNLTILGLGSGLTGSIPPELENLNNLTHLYLGGNGLTGCIPEGLRNVPNNDLDDLGLSDCGDTGTGDRDALIALYNATDGPNWRGRTNWLSDRPLGEWFGVTTNAAGRVTRLELRYRDGDLIWPNRLSGSIPPELGNLSALTYLHIWGGTGLSGSIPSELGNLSNLTSLSLSFNSLSGSIPSALGNLTSLEFLRLSGNQLSGPIPDELGNLPNLELLGLSDNRLSGGIPSKLGNLSKLEYLWLRYNRLSGSIPPELGNLGNLVTLDLRNNLLSGSIPPELVNLSRTRLFLSDNQLTGCIPAGLRNGRTHDLDDLGLPDCGTAVVGDRDVLVALYNATDGPNWVRSDDWLSDRPIGEWYGVTTDSAGRVTELELYTVVNDTIRSNGLSGNIPPELGSLSNLETLSLAPNELTGNIPPELGRLSKLNRLYLYNNQLTGQIPPELGNLRELRRLFLFGNRLSGSIPSELGNLTNLTLLYLEKNQLSGSIPSELGNLSHLIQLWLTDNQLSGNIPPELGNMTDLAQLFLRRNELSGRIPLELGNLSNLNYLDLHSNKLTGPIPPELGKLVNLQGLNLSNNLLSGSVPSALGSLSNLESLRLPGNRQLAGPLPDTLTNLKKLNVLLLESTDLCVPVSPAFEVWLDGIRFTNGVVNCTSTPNESDADRDALVALYNATDGPNWTNNTNWLSDEPLDEWFGVTTDASGRVIRLELYNIVNNLPVGNGLSGGIPPELGSLNKLERLLLINSRLSGSIPPELGNLTNLQVLELGRNQLSGSIPSELGNLTNLQLLKLDSNLLSGNIPPELGRLSKLWGLKIDRNSDLSGPLPATFTELAELRYVDLNFTGLCAPTDAAFQAWLAGIQDKRGVVNCVPTSPDRDALVALYNATDGPNWTNNTNWLSDEPLEEWYGVNVDAEGRVSRLHLGAITTSGLNGNGLSGSIPSAVGNLSNLQELVLLGNSFTGGIPPELGNLSNLRLLDLRFNVLSGSIPSSLGNLGSLRNLMLDNNQFSGSIPSSLGDLRNLTHLSLFYNDFTGSIPSSLGNLRNLVRLYLDDNQLSGSIPSELGNLRNLTHLILDNNQLSGSIPFSLGSLVSLEYLWLNDNADLYGPLSGRFELNEIDLRSLRLEGTGICAPGYDNFQRWLNRVQEKSGVVNCASLDRPALVALYNSTGGPTNWRNNTNWLSNRPLDEWYGVATDPSGRVTSLNLQGNQLSGTLPTELGNLRNLTSLRLSGAITGSIPSELGNLSNLTYLLILSTELTGSIPTEFGNLSNLRVLGLSGRSFGSIPSALGNLGNLRDLQLFRVSGNIPSALGNLSNLEILTLSHSTLSGDIPSALGNLSNLESLSLFDNPNLTGPLPGSFTRLSNLERLELRLTGLCAPTDAAFQAWVRGIQDKMGVVNCP